ncbi:MAG TPA: TerC family protein [Bryobacteraceae bacterium]|nr:TerC family protein [Bryobacteraceae bacterium]
MTTATFLASAFTIVVIDLLLAGDNALVIAMAVRSLAPRERRIGIICGSAMAVILRIALTVVAARLLYLPYLQAAGGLLVVWIAFRLMVEASESPQDTPSPRKLLKAIWVIVVADLTMSIDNILAIAAASHDHVGLIVFGLCLSIPFVIFSSSLLATLMNRYPILIYLGGAMLGKVAGDMILQDRFVDGAVHPSDLVRYLSDAVLILILVSVGRYVGRRRRKNTGTCVPSSP